MTDGEEELKPIAVSALGPTATLDDLDEDEWYLGTINGTVPYGVFVDLNDRIAGLVHESNLTQEYEVGDEIVVSIESIQPNGDIALDAADVTDYEVVPFDPDSTPAMIDELAVGNEVVTIEGRVDQINQTGGPTIFTICDGGGVLPCAAFEAAGVRAYPEVDRGDIVRALGSVTRHSGGLQLEVEALSVLTGDEAAERRETIVERQTQLAEPASVEPLVEWDVLDRLEPSLAELATTLRQAIIESRPVRVRHHADGDGMCAAVPVTIALERFAAAVHHDASSPDHLVSRAPSKAPYYEMEDATRDLNRALRDRDRHGQRLPLVLMLDNGSTEEDVPAYRNLAHYDIPIAVVDHHHPDPEATGDLLAHHVNPYLIGEDYRVTTGMLCVEIARMIDPTLTDDLHHLPAVAGLADRSSAKAMEAYLDLASDAGYTREDLTQIGDALDYAAHWLKFHSGDTVVRDILGIEAEPATHRAIVEHFAGQARAAIDDQLKAATPHLVSTTLENGATLYRLDVDAHAHRFRYPAPGKTTGAIHDAKVTEFDDPTVTLGFGPDFCVMRSDGVRLDFPTIVDDLRDEMPGAGISGGGHLVVGSIKFVPGQREAVVDALIDRIGMAPIDEQLTSANATFDDNA